MSKNLTPLENVSFQRNGKFYSGHFRADNKMISVTYRGVSKETQIGGSPVETLARMLLAELVQETEKENQK